MGCFNTFTFKFSRIITIYHTKRKWQPKCSKPFSLFDQFIFKLYI
ncbi:hypothetical protein CHCC20335_3920 [Bacillus paralicheniformis]|nr:hypothetical protein CHCC20335_3920 [Bacillus paralicheniformis]